MSRSAYQRLKILRLFITTTTYDKPNTGPSVENVQRWNATRQQLGLPRIKRSEGKRG